MERIFKLSPISNLLCVSLSDKYFIFTALFDFHNASDIILITQILQKMEI